MSRPASRVKAQPAAIALASAIACLMIGCGPAMRSVDRAPVHSMLASQAEAWNRGDIDAFMEYYWKSPKLTFSSGGSVHQGWRATIDRYRTRYPDSDAMGHLTFDLDQVRPLAPDAALALGRWRLKRAEPIGGNFSLVLQRIDGTWSIVHDHTSVLDEDESAMPIPELVPYLSVTDAGKAVAYYSRVFETKPVLLLNMSDGRIMHCEFRVGDARFFVSEELPEHGGTPSPESLGATTVAIHLYVHDCDAMVARMKSNGATVVMAPADMFWGERFARVRDPFGHEWGIATHLRDMTPNEIQAAAAELFEDMAD